MVAIPTPLFYARAGAAVRTAIRGTASPQAVNSPPVKLCRFDLATSPGTPRSGIVYGPKVYETEGANPVGVHDWSDARLLAPVGQPASLRLFPTVPVSGEVYPFRYLNPGILIGPNGSIARGASEMAVLPCLGVVIAGGGGSIPVADADEVLLGLTLANVFYQPMDSELEGLPAWSFDPGIAIGPAITTPDELDERVVDESAGRRYDLVVNLSHNGVEIQSFDVQRLGATVAQVLSFASLTTALRPGDLILIGLAEAPLPVRPKAGDQVRLASDALGALITLVT